MKKDFFGSSTILITGGTGSWGNELTRQLLEKYNPKQIRIYSRGEQRQVEMKRRFQDDRIQYYIGDVRDKDRLIMVMNGVDYVFHLAALKHVPVCEENPWEAVKTNIIGTQNIIEVAIENKVKKVIDVSTDKAVDPFNLYGVTKACGEKLVIAANLIDDTKFVCIRGGNVMGTNGSVIPLFKEQLFRLNEITITDEGMTRFLMRVEEAIELVLNAAVNSVGGEVFVMRTPACKIINLAKVLINKLGDKNSKIKHIGIRPGEKLFEVLVSKYEMPMTFEIDEYFVILPQIKIKRIEDFYKGKLNVRIGLEEFNSNNTHMLSQKEIESLLERDGWFNLNYKNEATNYLRSLNEKDLKRFFVSEGWVRK